MRILGINLFIKFISYTYYICTYYSVITIYHPCQIRTISNDKGKYKYILENLLIVIILGRV